MTLSQAILPVAGLGTRFLPWTKVVPKELLPIGNRPIIALLVDECMSVGIRDICFVINRGKEAIPQFFYEVPELEEELRRRGKIHLLEELTKYHEVNFHVVYQDELKGDGHAIVQARDWVKSPTVAVLFGDDLIVGESNGLQQMVHAMGHLKDKDNATMLCLQDVPREIVSRYGIVDIDPEWHLSEACPLENLRKVRNLVEKPTPQEAPSTLCIAGKYVIPKSVIEKLHQIEEGSHGEIRLIDALISHREHMSIYGTIFEGLRFDTGTPEGYKEAVRVLG